MHPGIIYGKLILSIKMPKAAALLSPVRVWARQTCSTIRREQMELRVLQYFLAIAREQSIIRAAESLHLSQPTLSTQIKNLEEELGKQLLIRGTKGSRKVTLTEEGMILRKRAEEILDLVKKTEKSI